MPDLIGRCHKLVFLKESTILSGGKRRVEMQIKDRSIKTTRGRKKGELIVCESALHLLAEVEGKQVVADVAPFFKKLLGSLIEKRRRMIEREMPKEVRLNYNGFTKEYQVSDKDLNQWLKRIKSAIPEQGKLF